jgi:D-aspartate ligase
MYDTSVPVLLVKQGRYPYHHGALAIVRSFGRVGVPVYAITEDPYTPVARSRYLTGRMKQVPETQEHPEILIAQLLDIAERLGRPLIPIPTDDAAAVALAEHADALRTHYLMPQVPPDLPRMLASKRGMFDLCRKYGVPTPRSMFPNSIDEAIWQARELTFPVVAKNIEPWTPRETQLVKSTTVIRNERELRERFGPQRDLSGLLLQEYIPHEYSEDWFVALYAAATPVVQFVGQKARAWPPRSGFTADGRAVPNLCVNDITAAFVGQIGWRGPADVEWRLDQRNGRYALVDFNVRIGAQFRSGQSRDGIDVARAMHLHLTGREIPSTTQDYTRRLVVGNLLLPTLIGERLADPAELSKPLPSTGYRTERAWLAADDPVPALIMAGRGGRSVTGAMLDNWHTWRRRKGRR